MTKLAMLCCLKSNRRCTGAACLSTLNDRTRSFAAYEGQEVTLTAFARCNGCEAGLDEGFQEKLDRLVEGRTALIVAHRFSSIRVATRILVFEGGRIIGDGTHAELYASCPLYRELYDRQSL